MLVNYLIVAVGGAIGATIRYGVGQVFSVTPGQFPWPTLLVNVAGCLLMGLLLGYGVSRDVERYWLFAGVGILGALTTYSSFSGETLALVIDKSWWLALANILGNLAGSLAACAIGFGIAKM